MKLVQFWRPNLGYRVGFVRGENVLDVTMPEVGLKSTNDFIENAAAGNLTLTEFVEQQLDATPRVGASALISFASTCSVRRISVIAQMKG